MTRSDPVHVALTRLFCTAFLMLVPVSAVSAFELNTPITGVHEKAGKVVLAQLAIGDRAYINWREKCFKNKRLHVWRYTEVRDAKYVANKRKILVEIIPDNQVDISVLNKNGTKLSSKQNLELLADIYETLECSIFDMFFPTSDMKSYYKVNTINGYASTQEILTANTAPESRN